MPKFFFSAKLLQIVVSRGRWKLGTNIMAKKLFVLGLPGSGKSAKVSPPRHSKSQKDELIVIVIELRATTNSDPNPYSLATEPPFSKTFRTWMPTNGKDAFFTLIALIYLVFAAIHFSTTGDCSMLNYLLGAVATYAGVKGIGGKFKQRKDKSNL